MSQIQIDGSSRTEKAEIRNEASDQSHSPAQAIWEIGLTLATALGLAVLPNLAVALGVL
ncbi:MAG: hypothetical protein JOZ17_16480 [Acetobacteraceae bacterium]|nr:hypothetical protein [Acetobacteraceae bacterium]